MLSTLLAGVSVLKIDHNKLRNLLETIIRNPISLFEIMHRFIVAITGHKKIYRESPVFDSGSITLDLGWNIIT